MKARKSISGITLCALLASAVGVAQAATVQPTVQRLIDGSGSVTAGDKLFDQWGGAVNFGSSTPLPTPLTSLDVTPLSGGLNPGPGLNFSFGQAPFSVTGDGLYAYHDFGFTFRVTAQDPSLQITGASLGGLFAVLSSSTGLNCSPSTDPNAPCNDLGVAIVEWVYGDSGLSNLLGTMTDEFSYLNGQQTGFATDTSISFAGHSSIWVVKDILVWSLKSTDTATLFSFDQRFSQTAVTIPEPASYGLAVFALLAAGAASRSRRKASNAA